MNIIPAIKGVARKTLQFGSQNAPTIMSIGAMGGVGLTAVLAGKGAVSYHENLEHIQKHVPEIDTGRTKVGLMAESFWPAAVSGIGTCALIFGANHINLKRNAALIALLASSQADLKTYKDKVQEFFGEKKATALHDEIAKAAMEANPYDESQVIHTGLGTHLYYDTMSGNYFRSCKTAIDNAVNEFNRLLLGDYFGSVNDFYELLRLPIGKLGEMAGWNADEFLRINYTSMTEPITGEPCGIINYALPPRPNFR